MNNFLDLVFLDNTVRMYLIVAGTILLALILKRILSRYIAGLVFTVVKKIAKGVDKKSFVDLVVSPLEIFLLLLVSLISIEKLTFPAILNVRIYRTTTASLLEVASIIIFIISFFWLLLRIID